MSQILGKSGYVFPVLGLLLVSALIAFGTRYSEPDAELQQTTRTIIDGEGPRSPWGKTVGDIDGDGRPDLVVGGRQQPRKSLFARLLRKFGLADRVESAGELVWYQNPTWQKHVVATDFYVRTDLAVGDIDSDGKNDVVVLADSGVYWLENPSWKSNKISVSKTPPKFHDVELSDLDGDGDLDLVLRNQSLFGHEDGNRVYVLIQEQGMSWREFVLEIGHGEGLKVADLDNDGRDDIVVNDVWLKNPGGRIHGSQWEATDYTNRWTWQHVYIETHDINSDGVLDILLSPAESVGDTYRISWFESPTGGASEWVEHIVDGQVEAVHHFVGAGDFNGDGLTDIFSAEMNQSEDPDEVKVYLNEGEHAPWKKLVLDQSGSHSMQVADFDGDRDAEVAGANWQLDDYKQDYPVSMWDFAHRSRAGWKRHVIGNNGPWRNLFVYVSDLDADQFVDIVAGRSWFKNPGSLGGNWRRHEFGGGLGTALFVDDFDGDGDIDIFGTFWNGLLSEPGLALRAKAKLFGDGYPGSGDGGKFLWARNDGGGNFRILDNIESADGDYLQGIASQIQGENSGLLLSWHRRHNGIQRVIVPEHPEKQTWTIQSVTEYSQDEQLSSLDIDGDGLPDIVTGTSWLNAAKHWEVNRIYETDELPDRHAIGDLNSDGREDVVVGYEAISSKGKLAWYSAITSSTGSAISEYVIDYPIGPMSLSAIDMDDDGDIDVVVGEHNLEDPESANLLLFSNLDGEGRDWRRSVIAQGDEHHNGALVVDLDRDGDKDVVSIGWGHSNVLVYENLRIN